MTERCRRGWLVWRRLPWWAEVGTIALAYVVYEVTRALAAPRRAPAVAHGWDLFDAERWLHLNPEATLNHAVNAWDPLADAVGYFYSTMHFVVTPVVLILLWRSRPALYPRLRTALFLATGAGLLVFIAWPAAPPRFTTGAFTDTLVHQHIMGMADAHGVTSLINQYAAMPSLHVGWAVWSAVAVVLAFRSPWRHAAWLYPAATTFVVLSTANHYVLDAVAGALLIAATVAFTAPGRVSPRRLSTVPAVPPELAAESAA